METKDGVELPSYRGDIINGGCHAVHVLPAGGQSKLAIPFWKCAQHCIPSK